ncbi:cryptochrome/photolyase family protein [Pseudophaeobacter profundi]|uniref:cryptochrome/photolyase family protein n=1 Tax=Pseudophaeobacter profundi TaxID=3034152 RepID=UPI00242DA018|nr:deoxyribodipyrimidine photo-lyase [Pseudophaeobacter profundi]
MSETKSPIILWFRRDFRLAEHAALSEAVRSGRPIVPVFVLDEVVETYGAAPKWRLDAALRLFDERLKSLGSRLILRRGRAADVLASLAKETGAGAIWWTRAYDPDAITRDTAVKSSLASAGYDARSFAGHLLFEPWSVKTKQGGFFKVYTPMWRAVRDRPVERAEPAPQQMLSPNSWPDSDQLESWGLQLAMNRGGDILARHACVGEARALDRLEHFLDGPVIGYKERRDFPAEEATSRLSENLTWGEIGPRTIWHAGVQAMNDGKPGAEHFLKELVWREFSYHLAYHSPEIISSNWRPDWSSFPWQEDEDEAVLRWKMGRTGVPLVDAAMRQLYVTGYMHNRCRMIAGSYLTKHLLKHWRIGQQWFEDCLIDWDPAANAMGWQWVAGSGPDASPFFRIFNPQTQAEKFDGKKVYVHRYLAELSQDPGRDALDFYQACPHCWQLAPDDTYPEQMIDLGSGRRRALAAYEQMKSRSEGRGDA